MSIPPPRPGPLATRIQAVLSWLGDEAWQESDTQRLVEHWITRICDTGMPLHRVNIVVSALHPEVVGISFTWTRASGRVNLNWGNRRQIYSDGTYDKSPFKLMIETGAAGIRRRLDDPHEFDDFAILGELRTAKATDYLALLGSFGSGGGVFGTWTSDRPGGFTTEELCAIATLFAALSHILENHVLRRTAINLLDTYVGHRAGERILAGQILRGTAEGISAVIWLSDLRNFTAMSDHMPRDALIALLNDYFDRLAQNIGAHGGEILKFMGDGVLAVFPTAELGGEAAASRCAIAAAEAAHAAIAAWNDERRAQGLDPIGHGVALHAGEVSFGNVGSSSRLDFTVVGPAVNLVHRLERLCSEMELPLILSSAIARHVPEKVDPLGARALRGLREPQTLFTLSSLRDGV